MRDENAAREFRVVLDGRDELRVRLDGRDDRSSHTPANVSNTAASAW
jgi:hypothetical protein